LFPVTPLLSQAGEIGRIFYLVNLEVNHCPEAILQLNGVDDTQLQLAFLIHQSIGHLVQPPLGRYHLTIERMILKTAQQQTRPAHRIFQPLIIQQS
jgi:hypothetical protein